VVPVSTPVRPPAPVRAALWAAAVLVALGALISALPGPFPDVVHWGWFGVRQAAQALAAGVLAARMYRHREARAPWLAVALAIVAWTAGDLLNATGLHDAAVAAWFACYMLVYLGLALLTRPLLLRGQAAVWLDGVAGALTCAAVVIDPTVRAVPEPVGEVIANLSYPLFDLVLAGMTLGTFALMGWRPPPAWRLLGLAVATMLAGDVLYFAA
jgi:diguanylate cyclase